MDSIWNKVNQNIPEILRRYRRVAVVGLSDNPYRASYGVASYLLKLGFTIFPVNPNYTQVLGLTCYPDLPAIGQTIEIVDIFRRAEDVPPIVEQAIQIGAKVIWMQSGIINEAAAQKALDAGLDVVMDVCIKMEAAKLK